MTEHLPILPVLLPMLAAPVAVIIGQPRVARTLAVIVAWLDTAIAAVLLKKVMNGPDLRYEIGGWQPPYGIEYVVDPLAAMVTLLVTFVAAVVITGGAESIGRQIARAKQTFFYATYLLCVAGLLGMTLTGDLFNVFVFLEISSLSSYALIALGPSRRAMLASFQYLIAGTIGATFFLIGIGLLYQLTGTLNIADIANRLPVNEAPRTLLVALGIMSVGLAIKMALFPLHTWLPSAYATAPDSVTAFLAATSTKVSIYAFVRLVFTIFSGRLAFDILPLDSELMVLALVGVFIASAGAVFQTDMKRVLAFSSIAQVGYILTGVSVGTTAGLAAAIAHMMHHGVIKGGLFMAVMTVGDRFGDRSSPSDGSKHLGSKHVGSNGSLPASDPIGGVPVQSLRGLGRTMPVTAMLITAGLLGLIGVPLTAGFVSKWMLVQSSLGIDMGWAAALILVASLIAVAYSWRIVETMYFQSPCDGQMDAAQSSSGVATFWTSVLVVVSLAAGLVPFIARWSTLAAERLLGVGT